MSKFLKWAFSRQGMHDIGAVCATVLALVKGLQEAGLI